MKSEFETLEQYQDSMKKFNENTRIGFENFIQSHGSERNKLQLRFTPYTDKKGCYGSFELDFGLSLWQHQQSKIDELQKRVDESESKLLKLSEFIYGCGDFREYSRDDLVDTQRTLKEILIAISLPLGESD